MSDARTIRTDPKDYRLDARLLRRIWRLITPYWGDCRHWKSWVYMLFGVAVGPAWAYYNYWIGTVTAHQTNLLIARDAPQWLALFWLIFFLQIGKWIYDVILNVLHQLVLIDWYGWMTRWMTQRYLGHRTYYDIALNEDIDNPDERIQNSLLDFINTTIDVPLQFLTAFLSVITSSALIGLADSSMTYFVFAYSIGVTGLQVVLYWPLIRLNFNVVAAQADLRFGLLRVRDNAETIAFFGGEEMEQRQVDDRLERVVRSNMRLYYWQTALQGVLEVTGWIWTLAPLYLIYPLYFAGKIEFGAITVATGAAMTLRSALMSLNNYIPQLAALAPRAVRLAQIVERHDAIAAAEATGDGHITMRRGDAIELDRVCFETPGGEQRLARDVSLSVRPGDSLIVTGATGVGKSSVLRSMAGLWPRGSGTITMPPPDDIMFVPQKPYMMLGDLRAQLLYPHGRATLDDAALQAVLERVCLPDLLRRVGGLNAEIDWGKVLSLGEQQRISFARILISRPRYVFLDESTSAVDVPTEERLYRALIESGVTFVSVGHRETILRFHDRALRLYADGGWDIVRSGEIATTPIEPLGAAR